MIEDWDPSIPEDGAGWRLVLVLIGLFAFVFVFAIVADAA